MSRVLTPEQKVEAIWKDIEREAKAFKVGRQLGFDCLPLLNLRNHFVKVERLVHGLAIQVRGKQCELFQTEDQKRD